MKVVAILSMLHEAAGAPDSAVASTNSSFRLSQDGTGGDLIAEAGDSGTQNFETAGDGAGAAVAAPVQALTTSAATGAVGDNSATRRLRGEPVKLAQEVGQEPLRVGDDEVMVVRHHAHCM